MIPHCYHCNAAHAGTCSEYQARLAGIGPSLIYSQSLADMLHEQAEVAALERMWSLPARGPR